MLLARIKGALRRLFLRRLRWARGYALIGRLEAALLGRKVRLEACSQCQLKCPTCARVVKASDEDFPFCSDRCRRIDLGKWAMGCRLVTPLTQPELDAFLRKYGGVPINGVA